MADRPHRTKLDPELSLLDRQLRANRVLPGALTTRGIALEFDAAKADADGKQEITLQLVIDPARVDDARKWIGEHATSSSFGPEVVVATIEALRVRELGEQHWLRRAEIGRPLSARLDEARGPITGLSAAVARHSLSGQDVVIGVIDTGVDWRHRDFRNEAGTRIEYFAHAWTKPAGPSTYVHFGAADIDQELGASPPGKVPHGDPVGHGTHCASIAAGNGRTLAGRYSGVAPNATIAAVRSDGLMTDHISRGIKEIFELAGDRPAVISLSLGGHHGAHDGTSALERTIATESGPGRIVVAAAGNEASDGIHWFGMLREEQELLIPFVVRDEKWQFVDVWVRREDEVDVRLQGPDGALLDANGSTHATPYGRVESVWREDDDNLDQNLALYFTDAIPNQRWMVRITPRAVVSGDVHAWAGTLSPANAVSIFDAPDTTCCVGIPGTADRAITVASIVSRARIEGPNGTHTLDGLTVGALSDFSSRGPTRHGLLKPDIAAPGQYVTAALASDSHYLKGKPYRGLHHPSREYLSLQGTSMATPFVAGVIALLLERRPHLTPEDVAMRLRVTARRDRVTGRVWNPGFGHGCIDVEAFLDFRQ